VRFLTANMVYPVTSEPVQGGIVVIDDAGKIIDVIDPQKQELTGNAHLEEFEGILCPGFVNAHCHLELSHLKGKLTERSGLTGFIDEIVAKRVDDEEKIVSAAIDADKEMHASGIVAAGDISNTDSTIQIKLNSKIHYHTFVELFDLLPERAKKVFQDGIILQNKFLKKNLNASITPHAPYTVSQELLKMIGQYSRSNNSILTIHNQETESENEMFQNASGILFEQLKKMIPAFEHWNIAGKNSLQYVLDNIKQKIQLVHNTFTRKEDLPTVLNELFFCLCLNANLFIENKTPDVQMLHESGCKFTIGTDSYASNHSLSIFDEIKSIRFFFPEIPLHEILKWATLNGAQLLRFTDRFGSLEKDKTPGIVNMNFELDYSRLV
jgi:cytosine/adenosine deaminase-related metal-dependent hydrolase